MPPRPRAPRSRVSTLRRPRVAGLTPGTPRAESDTATHEPGTHGLAAAAERPAAPRPTLGKALDGRGDVLDAEFVDEGVRRDAAAESDIVDAEVLDDGPGSVAQVTGESGARARIRRLPAVPLLAAALVVLTGLAVFFGVRDAALRGTPAATNTALVDVGATAEAAGQLSDALETVYSFDFARLDENERAAREVITPEFAAGFDRLFAEVRQQAPLQQAVVSATVTLSAVKEITGDRAVLVAFVDQQATRAAAGTEQQQLAAAGRLTVIGERVDGRWKIAGVEPR
jgi:Mce-associated membrane protein